MKSGWSRRQVLEAVTIAGVFALSKPALAQPYPMKPVRLLVGAGAGSVPDILARLVAERLAAKMGQPFVVENRPGAGGIPAMQALSASAADGYTLALATMSQAVFNGYLFSALPYDPLKDLEPISLLATNAFSVAVPQDSPLSSIGELIKHGRTSSAELLVGTTPPGTPPHIFALLLVRSSGVKARFIPYKSGIEGLTGLIRSEIQVMVDSPAAMTPLAKAGSIRVIAVSGPSREPALPDTPTLAEAGLPVAEGLSWFGLVAPAGTATDIIARLNTATRTVMQDVELGQRLAALSFMPASSTSDAFRKLIRDDHRRWGAVIQEAGLKLD